MLHQMHQQRQRGGMEILVEPSSALDRVENLAHCQTEQQIEAILQEVVTGLGFQYFYYRARFMLDRTSSLERTLSNFPRAWLEFYEHNALSRVDPAVQHAERKLTPMVWTPTAYTSEEQLAFLAEARKHGVHAGVSFPIHSKDGDIGVLSMALGPEEPRPCALIQAKMFHGPLIATFVHDAMARIVNKSKLTLKAPLTPRELECLKWIADGKSTWETAQILHLSEHGVLHHVRNIMYKFDVTSRHQAVSRAIACGLV